MYTMEYYSAINDKKEILSFAAKWMELEAIKWGITCLFLQRNCNLPKSTLKQQTAMLALTCSFPEC
jgi:hypothetical protein